MMEPRQNNNNSDKPIDRKWWIIGITAGLLITLFAIGMIPRIINTMRINAIAAEISAVNVAVLQLKPNTKPLELNLPSSAQGWHSTPIWARVNGYLIRYLVDIGDSVKAGDLLAEIDTPETDAELARAQADLANSLVELDIAKITSDRWETLWNKNKEAVSKQEVDQYKANMQSAEAVVLSNQNNVARLTYQQQFKFVYAPFDGVITQRSVDIGHLIYGNLNGTPQELFRIAQSQRIRFFVDVPQTYFRQIKKGIEAVVSVDQFPSKTFKGSITRFAKALDPTARTLLTEVDVDNREGMLFPGLYGTVKFILPVDTVTFIIPTTAVIIRSGLPHVAVVDENNVIHMKQVEIGLDFGNRMEIVSGLQENDRIVTIPNDRIREGVKVNILESTEAVK